jgi:hypothetical protein
MSHSVGVLAEYWNKHGQKPWTLPPFPPLKTTQCCDPVIDAKIGAQNEIIVFLRAEVLRQRRLIDMLCQPPEIETSSFCTLSDRRVHTVTKETLPDDPENPHLSCDCGCSSHSGACLRPGCYHCDPEVEVDVEG